jgi:tight adherence protein C
MDASGLLVIAIGAFCFIFVFALAWLLLGGRQNVEKRVRAQNASPAKEKTSWGSHFKISWAARLGELIPRSPQDMSKLEQRLAKAGIRHKDAAVLFNGGKLFLGLFLVLVFFLAGLLQQNLLLFPLLSLMMGCMLLDVWLNRKIAARKDSIQLALPDALDLMVLCVEAGLGLDQALARIGQELKGGYSDLSEEFELYSLEVTSGKKREEALRNLGQRSGTDDLKAFANALIQANRFGVAIAQSLRVFSDSMRVKRRQRLEERANKMSIKMIPVLVFFILPAIFIVEVGPAFLQIMDTFANTAK